MFVSRVILALLLVSWSDKALAKCNLDSTLSFLGFLHGQKWEVTNVQEIETSEGPGTVSEYATNDGLKRTDENYCASNYCLSTVSVSSPSLHRQIYFFSWGGGAFPDVVERSIAFENKTTNEICSVHHSGGDMFTGAWLTVIDH